MSRRVFVHVGAPKTGTTYVQDRLTRNAGSLARHGVHFPARHPLADPAISQFRAALDLLGQDWGGPRGHAEGDWAKLVRRIRRLEGTVVVSHEILGPAKPHQVARAVRDLGAGGAEVHVVLSARDLGRQLPAAWQESIKQGRTWSYGRFLRRMQHGNAWFARAFDLPAVLATWGEALPPEHLHVVTVPHGRGDLLWPRFCEVVGADPAWAPREAERVNRSLGVAETMVLRQLNRRVGRATRREAPHEAVVRRMLKEGMLANRRGSSLQLPPDLHPWAVAEAERWTGWIREHHIHVAGDLDDLMPAPPVEDYVDPRRASNKAQLASALDALAALTAEAARRTDPDQRLPARVQVKLRNRRDHR